MIPEAFALACLTLLVAPLLASPIPSGADQSLSGPDDGQMPSSAPELDPLAMTPEYVVTMRPFVHPCGLTGTIVTVEEHPARTAERILGGAS